MNRQSRAGGTRVDKRAIRFAGVPSPQGKLQSQPHPGTGEEHSVSGELSAFV